MTRMSLRGILILAAVVSTLGTGALVAQQNEPKTEEPATAPAKDEAPTKPSSGEAATPETPGQTRANSNLLGQADTSKGEGRRNEHVQINLVDTNAARELNARVGTTATIIEEFRVDRNYFSSEYGTAPGSPIHAAPQRGVGIHGNLFWNHNNSIFSARSFFQAGPVQPARRNQYGAGLGMGLWKGAFFSFNGSQDKNRGNVNGNILIPLPNERTPLATDPATRAVVERLLDAYPNVAPNRPDIAVRALNTNSLQSVNTNFANGQLDQKLGGRDTLMFRYTFTSQQVDAFQFVKGQNPNTDNKSHDARITWNRVWSPRTVFNLSVDFNRQGTLLVPTGDAVGPIFLNGLQMLGPGSNIPIDRSINQFRYDASVQHRRGRHAFTAGFAFTRQQYNGYETEGSRPTFQFRDDFGRDMITNLRLGTPSTYSGSFGQIRRAFRNWELHAFAGDDWAVSNKLTVNFGIRWEPWTLPVDALGLSHLNFHSDWNNVGGNFGFAYRLPKGVLRGAFGILDGQLFPVAYGQDRFNPPYNIFVSVQAPDLVDPLKNVPPEDLLPGGRTVRFDIDPNLATPYSYQYNLSWENEFAGGWRVQLGYVGSRTLKLFQTYQLNRAQPVDGIPFTTATVNLRRPDQSFYQRFYTLNSSRAYYDAARVTLVVPRWHGVTLSGSYWFSKSIDLGSDYAVTGGGQERWRGAGQTETGVLQDQKGLSNFDQPHAFLLQGAWDTGRGSGGWLQRLYRNWTLTSVFLLKSGTPFTVDSGADSPGFGNADGTNGDRPDVVDPSVLGRTIGNPETSVQLLPRSAFRFMNAPLEMAGNLGRNTFRKGKIANLNAAVSRTWALPREWTVTLRGEAINLSNTPQFAEPGTSLTSPNFGQITNTLNDGRTFRFLLRLAF
jgi:hypothetical protein